MFFTMHFTWPDVAFYLFFVLFIAPAAAATLITGYLLVTERGKDASQES